MPLILFGVKTDRKPRMVQISTSGQYMGRCVAKPNRMETDHTYCLASEKKAEKGLHYCCVCHMHRGKIVDGRKVSLHRFPADKKVAKVWMTRVKLAMVTAFVLTANSRLCSEHFVGKKTL